MPHLGAFVPSNYFAFIYVLVYKAGHDSPWLFLGARAGKPMSLGSAQLIYNHAVEKSGVRRKGGIHVLRHYPEFRTVVLQLWNRM